MIFPSSLMRFVLAGGRADHHFVDVAPAPVVAALEAAHHRMASLLEVAGRVPVRRAVTAADVATRKTKAQLGPARARAEAFLATGRRPRLHRFDLIEMRAFLCHWRWEVFARLFVPDKVCTCSCSR